MVKTQNSSQNQAIIQMVKTFEHENKLKLRRMEIQIEELLKSKYEVKMESIATSLHKLKLILTKTKAENVYYKEQYALCMSHLENMRKPNAT